MNKANLSSVAFAPPAATQPKPPTPSASQDPDEVDISDHYYAPSNRNDFFHQQAPNNALQGFDPFTNTPRGAGSGNEQLNQDPMIQMLQAMMGGAGGPGAGFPGGAGGPGGNPGEGLPPGLAEMFGALSGQGPAAGEQEQTEASNTAYIWRIVHAIFSLTLGFYVAIGSNFSGSKFTRTNPPSSSFVDAALEHHQTVGQRLFYLFATFEVVLQSSRYFLEKGQLKGSGWLSSISKFLPQPYGGYVRVVGRYSMIYSTVVADAMIVVFILGLVAWWKGAIV
jgi:GET complex subunit GET2